MHQALYDEQISQLQRLNCLELTPGSFSHLQRSLRERLERESAIPEEDITETIQQIIALPSLGGHKGSLKLQHDEKALIGQTVYADIKRQLVDEAARELLKRREQSELQKNHDQRQQEKKVEYEKIIPRRKHDVWSIDFVTFLLFGIYFRICVVYDIFSQSYLSIIPAEVATKEIAIKAVVCAFEYSGTKPRFCVLADNGGQFSCDDFEAVLKFYETELKHTPPGQPWHNGALESGNRDLKKMLYTTAFYDAAKNIEITRKGVASQQILQQLEDYCTRTQQVINEKIVRPKFMTTPKAVLNDQVYENNTRRHLYVEKKRTERKQRMEQIKKEGGSKHKRIEDKVTAIWKKIARQMTTEQIFAFSELVNERYRAVAL